MSTLRSVATELAPKAIGPYSQAIVAGDEVWTSGQIALDPVTGILVSGGTEAETRRVLANLDAVLQAAQVTRSDVVRCTIFLVDLADFAVVNEIYGAFFGTHRPARSTVQVAALPKGARVEIDAVARRSSGG
jgi:2-iminobutanoate/2-iminopropanoate deaminase